MAVQAQYQSNAVFASRGDQETKNIEFQLVSSAFVDQSRGGNNMNNDSRKSVGEGIMKLPPQMMMQQQNNHHHGQQPYSPLVSTGLRLAFEDRPQSNPFPSSSNATNNFSSSPLPDHIAAQVNRQKQEIDRLIAAQTVQLRRSLAEKRQRHMRALERAAEEMARRLREEESKIERASRRRAELEERVAKLQAESTAWRMEAMTNRATAASYGAQIHYLKSPAGIADAAVAAEMKRRVISHPSDDAGSAHVDPNRVEPARACRTCCARPATVVLFPCRHLCVCENCDAGSVGPGLVPLCPVCRAVRTGSVRVFFD